MGSSRSRSRRWDARKKEVCSYNNLSYSTLVSVITSLVETKTEIVLAGAILAALAGGAIASLAIFDLSNFF